MICEPSPADDGDALGQRKAPQELGEQDQEGDHDQPELRAGSHAAAQHASHGLHRRSVCRKVVSLGRQMIFR